MELTTINKASDAPAALQRAAKCALVVGAQVHIDSEREALFVKFDDGDRYHFDPDDATLHALEMLGQARTKGFVRYTVGLPPPGYDGGNIIFRDKPAWFIVRVVFSNRDVRVQIGASRWYVAEVRNTALGMRRALVDAFCAYYDEAIAPYTEA